MWVYGKEKPVASGPFQLKVLRKITVHILFLKWTTWRILTSHWQIKYQRHNLSYPGRREWLPRILWRIRDNRKNSKRPSLHAANSKFFNTKQHRIKQAQNKYEYRISNIWQLTSTKTSSHRSIKINWCERLWVIRSLSSLQQENWLRWGRQQLRDNTSVESKTKNSYLLILLHTTIGNRVFWYPIAILLESQEYTSWILIGILAE